MLDDATGELSVLEANAIPGLTDTSLLPLAAEAAGIGFDAFVARVLALAGEEVSSSGPRELGSPADATRR